MTTRGRPVKTRSRSATRGGGELAPERLYKLARSAIERTIGAKFDVREDLVQEVLTRALRGLSNGHFLGASGLSTWVSAIARHVALEEVRASARRHAPDSSEAELPSPLDFEHQLEARSMLDSIALLLETMDPTTVRIIVLHDLVGHDLTEVACLTKLSITAVQSRLVRGRKLLHRKLVDRDSEA